MLNVNYNFHISYSLVNNKIEYLNLGKILLMKL